jgi:hypothetical protein
MADVPHDWLGVEIAVGTRVLYRNSRAWGIGAVTKLRREFVAGAPGVQTCELDEWVLDIAWELRQPYMQMTCEPSTDVGVRIRIENVTAWPPQLSDRSIRSIPEGSS